MTDRELLELAAKAAGYEFCRSINEPHVIRRNDRGGLAKIIPWNPLTDDGDALRLAVRLSIKVEPLGFCACRVETRDGYARTEAGYESTEAATRRAIVRAAAEMAKEKP